MILSDRINFIKIEKCHIYNNKKFGVHFMGHDG